MSVQIRNYLYRYDSTIAVYASVIVIATNLFWVIAQALIPSFVIITSSYAYCAIALSLFTSLNVLVFFRFLRADSPMLTRFLLLAFITSLMIETCILVIDKNRSFIGTGWSGYTAGISLSTFYLFIPVFITMPGTADTVYLCIGLLTSLSVPLFFKGSEFYGAAQNTILGVSLIVGYFVNRQLLITSAISHFEVKKSEMRYRNLTDQALKAIVSTIDAKDRTVRGHSVRVAQYARALATEFGYTREELDKVYFSGLLHDVGKIAIPDEILNKPAKLTDEEYEVIKTHSEAGYDILNNLNDYPYIKEAARWHHEKYDGSGYPDRLSGNDIPFMVRIITVADAFDTMKSSRPYSYPKNKEAIIAEFARCTGSQFDPEIANKLIDLLKANRI